MPVVLALAAFFALRGTDRSTTGMVYETESAYNYIQVLEKDGFTYLRLNEGQGVHSIYHPTILNYNGPWEQVLVAPYFNAPPYTPDQVKRIAILGLAAGTAARDASLVYGGIPIDGYEIDGEIVKVARRYFDMNQSNLNVFVQDARVGLAASDEHVRHHHGGCLPAALHPLAPDHAGILHLGVTIISPRRACWSSMSAAPPDDRRVVNALATTLRTVFPTIHAVDIPNSFNTMLFATRQATSAENFLANYELLAASHTAHPLLLESMQLTAANLQPAA